MTDDTTDTTDTTETDPALVAQPAALRAVITITRAATGKVETYTITGSGETDNDTPSKE